MNDIHQKQPYLVKLAISVALVLASGNISVLAAEGVTKGSPKIIGGTPAAPQAYPWMAALLSAGSDAASGQFCGGSLIRADWVLTAAHCVESEQASGVEVLLGQTDLNGSGGERIAVKRIIIHPDYAEKQTPDLALLQLSKTSQQTPVQTLQQGSQLAKPGTVAKVIGWGLTKDGDNASASPVLQQVAVPIVPHNVCNQAYGNSIIENDMICAGFAEGGKDSCQGDSGGPLFVAGPQGSQYRQAGVVSFGNGCAVPNSPGVYARVSSYNQWIASSIGDTSPTTPQPPTNPDDFTAKLSVDCNALSCQFDGSQSSAGGSEIKLYVWEFGDGFWDFGVKSEHNYQKAGDYTARLHIINAEGRLAVGEQKLTVTDNGSNPNPGANSQTFTGSLEPYGYVILPDENGFSSNAGEISARLQGPTGAEFELLLEKLDPNSGEWIVVAVSDEAGANDSLSYQGEAGQYDWVILSNEKSGDYTLTMQHP